MRKSVWMGIVAIIAVLGLWFAFTAGSRPSMRPESPAPASSVLFTLPDLEGNKIAVGKAEKVTIINFWATWCPPCRSEMPELNKFVQNHPETLFYAVNIQESPDKVKEFMQQHNYTLHVLTDTDGKAARKFQITAIPTTIVLDKNGNIKYRKSGGMTQAELENVINE
jgi:cytochrome c biogenesis protein CcmG/thiol:disulfide interchange protein DsbE